MLLLRLGVLAGCLTVVASAAAPAANSRVISVGPRKTSFQLRGSRVVCLVESPLRGDGQLLAIGCGLSRVRNQSPVPQLPEPGTLSAAIWDLAGIVGRVNAKPPLFTTLWVRSWPRPTGGVTAPPAPAPPPPIFVEPPDTVLLAGTDVLCKAVGERSSPSLACGFDGPGGRFLRGTFAYVIDDRHVAFSSVGPDGRFKRLFVHAEPPQR